MRLPHKMRISGVFYLLIFICSFFICFSFFVFLWNFCILYQFQLFQLQIWKSFVAVNKHTLKLDLFWQYLGLTLIIDRVSLGLGQEFQSFKVMASTRAINKKKLYATPFITNEGNTQTQVTKHREPTMLQQYSSSW